MDKIFCCISVFWLFLSSLSSCGSNSTQQKSLNQAPPNEEKVNAESLYVTRCVACHGTDGKLGAAGAKNLTVTKLSVDEVKQQIVNGKGAMPPFGNQLSEEEIHTIANYILTEIKEK
jgi:mono/diheme cytochrome c family protein